MTETIYLIAGFIILAIISYDFFFTTLSASGASFITNKVSTLAYQVILLAGNKISRRLYTLSGMLVNLTILMVWVLLSWLGLFLVFSYHSEGIVNSEGIPASAVDRLYFTGYVISTLGIGDFKPVTPFFEIVTSLFSFFGFIFFTTSMTYLVSISSAVINKREIAIAIRNIGTSPNEVVQNLLNMDPSFRIQQFLSFQQMIDKHAAYHKAYPVLHYYNNPKNDNSLSINLTILDEAISIFYSSTVNQSLRYNIQPLRNSLNHFLNELEKNYGEKADDLPYINWNALKLPVSISSQGFHDLDKLQNRRKILTDLLESEGYDWKEIYPSQVLERRE